MENPLDDIEGADYTFSVIYYSTWQTYEECGYLLVLYRDGLYYLQEGGHCVMGDSDPEWDPILVSESEALAAIEEWIEEYGDE